jgi:superfamily II DNA helicase RecQ
VTPESAVEEEFATFLNRLQATRQLDRIVIDECHIILNRRYTFRKQIQQLGRLVAAETQMVMLTATLPPSEKDELFRRMHFERDQVKIVQARTTRTNVAYQVIRVDKGLQKQEVETVVVNKVQQKMRQYKSGKIVIYGNSVAKVKTLAEKFSCDAYYHDAVGKASMLANFMAGKQRVMVATSALGMGVDIPDIRCIIHVDWPRTILDYAQKSSRAGRDRVRSEAIIIVQKGHKAACHNQQTEAEQQLVRVYVEGDDSTARCRRQVLDAYLDRREGREGCKDREKRCDVCRRPDEEMEEIEEGSSKDSSSKDSSDTGAIEVVESKGETAQQVFQQQQQERQGPRQALTQQRQQEFADVEWLRRQLA